MMERWIGEQKKASWVKLTKTKEAAVVGRPDVRKREREGVIGCAARMSCYEAITVDQEMV